MNNDTSTSLSDRIGIWITDRVGTLSFFIAIAFFTIGWCGYNTVAPKMHWHVFDSPPQFQTFNLIASIISLWLLPLIMVGQAAQAKQDKKQFDLDLKINQYAERELTAVSKVLKTVAGMVVRHMEHDGCPPTEEERCQLTKERKDIEEMINVDPGECS